jgi:hypothetical protein
MVTFQGPVDGVSWIHEALCIESLLSRHINYPVMDRTIRAAY